MLHAGIVHSIRCHPLRVAQFRLNLLSPHLFSNIRDSYPKHADWCRTSSRLVVYSQFNLVRFFDIHVVYFVGPSIGSCCSCLALLNVLNLHDYKCLGSPRKFPRRSMIDVSYRMNYHRQASGQGLPHIWRVQAIIYSLVSPESCTDQSYTRYSPSGASAELSISTCRSSYLFKACFRSWIF